MQVEGVILKAKTAQASRCLASGMIANEQKWGWGAKSLGNDGMRLVFCD
jgi:hypothetical protein